MALRTCRPEDLEDYFCRLLVLVSDDLDVIRAWSEVAEMIISDPLIHVPGSPTQIVQYNEGQIESTYPGPFTRDRLLEYCLAQTARSLQTASRPVRGLVQYTSKF